MARVAVRWPGVGRCDAVVTACHGGQIEPLLMGPWRISESARGGEREAEIEAYPWQRR